MVLSLPRVGAGERIPLRNPHPRVPAHLRAPPERADPVQAHGAFRPELADLQADALPGAGHLHAFHQRGQPRGDRLRGHRGQRAPCAGERLLPRHREGGPGRLLRGEPEGVQQARRDAPEPLRGRHQEPRAHRHREGAGAEPSAGHHRHHRAAPRPGAHHLSSTTAP